MVRDPMIYAYYSDEVQAWGADMSHDEWMRCHPEFSELWSDGS